MGWLVVALFVLQAPGEPRVLISRVEKIDSDNAAQDQKAVNLREPANVFSSLVEQPLTPQGPPEPLSLPEVSARSFLITDLKTGKVLGEKEARLPLPPASTTKILTALVSLNSYDLGEAVTVPEVCATLPKDQSQMGLRPGERITAENLLYGLLVQSASDAACALAYYYPSGEPAFVEAMNTLAQDLDMGDSFFVNPSGNDEVGQAHLSSAWDLSRATKKALDFGILRLMVGTWEINLPSVDQKYWHLVHNTNELLGTYPGTFGVKTGYTEQARGCLILAVARKGQEILVVVLGSEDRFSEAQALAEWAFQAYRWE